MNRISSLDEFFKPFAKKHKEDIKAEAEAVRQEPPKPKYKWQNQMWKGWNESPKKVNSYQSKLGRQFILTDNEKMDWDLKKLQWDKEIEVQTTAGGYQLRVSVLVDEWAIHYYTYHVEKVMQTGPTHKPEDYYWRRVSDEEIYHGSWPLCILKMVKNPKTELMDIFWDDKKKGSEKYIRLEEKYFNQLRHEIYFRGLRIPAFHSRYGGEVNFQGEETSTRHIIEYLEDLFTIEQLITFNKILKEVQLTNMGPVKGPNEANMSFPALYNDFIKAKENVDRLKKEIKRFERILPPKEQESGTYGEEGEEGEAE